MSGLSNTGTDESEVSIRLHLGAHKTATTYLQAELSRNAAVLAARDIVYVPMREFRSWRRGLSRPRPFRTRMPLARQLEQWNPECRRTCIISDENIIGTCDDIVRTGALYPKLISKLGVLAQMLRAHQPCLFLSVRSYDAFYAAAYCEALRHGTYCSVAAFKARVTSSHRTWRDVLSEIATVFPSSPIVVWRYEDFRGNRQLIFDELAGKRLETQWVLSDATIRRSLSHEAVERIEAFGRRLGNFAAKRLLQLVVSRVEARMPAATSNLFDPWTENERERLQELYAEDLSEIGKDARYRLIAT